MPHARIVAESPERARVLARQLQERGYTVEIVAPGASVNTPADLEITATDEVFAVPGSILGLVEYEPDDRPEPEYYLLDDQPPSAASLVRAALAQTWQAFAEGWQGVAVPLAARLRNYRAARAQRLDAERAERELRRAQTECVRAEQAEAARLARVAADEEARRRAEAAERARLAEIAAEKEQARRRARELERERSLRAARTAQQEEARRLTAYEQELTRRALEDRRCREAERRREREAVRLARLEMRPAAPIVPEPPPLRRWKGAFAAAAGVSALAVLALFFAGERRPAAPVSNQTVVDSEAVEQQTPFGAATALPAKAVLQKSANPAPSASDAPRPRPQKRRVFRVDDDRAALDEAEPEVIIRRAKRPPRAGEQAREVRLITDEEFDDEEEFE